MPRAALLFASCIVALSAAAAPANQAREVVTALPQRLSGQQQLSLTGSVVSLQQAQVSARSDGLVAEILADTGATVTRGQALLRLDAELAKLDRDRAEAARNEALAARNEARRLVQEAERLRKNNHVSENEVKSRRAALALAEASFAAAEASLASSREALARHTLPAPFDGVVSDRFTELGEWLNRGDPVFEVVSLNELRVDVQIPQERFGDIDVNTPVSICSDALAQPCIEGRIATQVPVSDPVSRTFLIRVAPVDRDQNLLPGTSAQVHFVIGSTQRSEYLIPRQAVLRHPDGSRSLFVVKDGRAQRRLITVSREVEKGLIITEGLSPEAVIIVQGADLLSDGDPVSAASAEER